MFTVSRSEFLNSLPVRIISLVAISACPQCFGSMTFWCGSGSGSADPCLRLMYPDPDPGSGSCYFRHWHSRCQQKTNKKKFFYLLLFEGTFTLFFKDKKCKISHKTVGIKVFLTIFACWKKDPHPDLYLWLMDPDPNPEGPKHVATQLHSYFIFSLTTHFRRMVTASNLSPSQRLK